MAHEHEIHVLVPPLAAVRCILLRVCIPATDSLETRDMGSREYRSRLHRPREALGRRRVGSLLWPSMTVSSSTTRQGELSFDFVKKKLVGIHVRYAPACTICVAMATQPVSFTASHTCNCACCPNRFPRLHYCCVIGTCGGKYAQWPSTRCPTVKQETLTMSCIVEQGEMRWLYGVGLSE